MFEGADKLIHVGDKVKLLPEESGGITRINTKDVYEVEEDLGDKIKLKGIGQPLYKRRFRRAWNIKTNNDYVKKGDKVRILDFVFHLKDIPEKDNVGTVVSRDGGYIYVRPKFRRWQIESYECELDKISEEDFKKVRRTT